MLTRTYLHAGVLKLTLTSNDGALMQASEELLGLDAYSVHGASPTTPAEADLTLTLERVAPGDEAYRKHLNQPWTAVGEEFVTAIGTRLADSRVNTSRGIARSKIYARVGENLPEVGNKSVVRPLRFLLAFRGWYFVHAALLEHEGRGVMICGPAGAGKTMLSLSLCEGGFELQSDDECYIKIVKGNAEAFGLPRQLGLAPVHLTEFPRLNQAAEKSAVYSGDKARLPFAKVSSYRPRSPQAVQLVIIPEYHPEGEAVWEPLSAEVCRSMLVAQSHCEELNAKATEVGFANLCAIYELSSNVPAVKIRYNNANYPAVPSLVQELLRA